MRELPSPDPGEPDNRSAARYLWWVARSQAHGMLAAAGTGIVWMVAQALMPAVIGHAIDAGVTARNGGALARWTVPLLVLGGLQAGSGVLRHRFSVLNWIGAAFVTVRVTVRKVVQLGATRPKRLAVGEVVSIGISDVVQIGGAMDIVGRGAGSVVAIIVVAVIMLVTYSAMPTGWPSSRPAGSASLARMTSWSPPEAPTRHCGTHGTVRLSRVPDRSVSQAVGKARRRRTKAIHCLPRCPR